MRGWDLGRVESEKAVVSSTARGEQENPRIIVRGSVLLPAPRARAPRRPAREPAFHFRSCVGVCPGGREGAGARGAARGRAAGEGCRDWSLPRPAAPGGRCQSPGPGAVAPHTPWCADTPALQGAPPPRWGWGSDPRAVSPGGQPRCRKETFPSWPALGPPALCSLSGGTCT